MSKKKITRSPRFGSDDIDVYISHQAKPRFVVYKTGERSSMHAMLDTVREFVRKHKSSLQPQYEFDAEGTMVPLDVRINEAVEPTVQKIPKTRTFRANIQPSSNMVTVIVNGTEIRIPSGSKVEFL